MRHWLHMSIDFFFWYLFFLSLLIIVAALPLNQFSFFYRQFDTQNKKKYTNSILLPTNVVCVKVQHKKKIFSLLSNQILINRRAHTSQPIHKNQPNKSRENGKKIQHHSHTVRRTHTRYCYSPKPTYVGSLAAKKKSIHHANQKTKEELNKERRRMMLVRCQRTVPFSPYSNFNIHISLFYRLLFSKNLFVCQATSEMHINPSHLIHFFSGGACLHIRL